MLNGNNQYNSHMIEYIKYVAYIAISHYSMIKTSFIEKLRDIGRTICARYIENRADVCCSRVKEVIAIFCADYSHIHFGVM